MLGFEPETSVVASRNANHWDMKTGLKIIIQSFCQNTSVAINNFFSKFQKKLDNEEQLSFTVLKPMAAEVEVKALPEEVVVSDVVEVEHQTVPNHLRALKWSLDLSRRKGDATILKFSRPIQKREILVRIWCQSGTGSWWLRMNQIKVTQEKTKTGRFRGGLLEGEGKQSPTSETS